MKKRSDQVVLSPKQVAEVERCLRDDDYASEEEVREVFARLKKGPRALRPSRRQRT
jgi:hypothetical protein